MNREPKGVTKKQVDIRKCGKPSGADGRENRHERLRSHAHVFTTASNPWYSTIADLKQLKNCSQSVSIHIFVENDFLP